jgi:hypothetical protein
MDPGHFYKRRQLEEQENAIKKALQATDIVEKDKQLKLALKKIQDQAAIVEDDQKSASSRPPTSRPRYSIVDFSRARFLKLRILWMSIRTSLSTEDQEMIPWLNSLREVRTRASRPSTRCYNPILTSQVLYGKAGNMRKFMRNFDLNKDGHLDRKEFKSFLSAYK